MTAFNRCPELNAIGYDGLGSPSHRGSETSMRTSKSAFTIIELLIAIAIIAILLGLVLVAIDQARARARSMQCLNNLRQTALGVRLYTDQHGGKFPDGQSEPWFMQIAPMMESEPSVFKCPDDPQQAQQSYGYRDESACFPPASLAGKRIDFVASTQLVMVYDSAPNWHAPGLLNIAMVNTSAQAMEEEEFEDNLLLAAERGAFLDLHGPTDIPEE